MVTVKKKEKRALKTQDELLEIVKRYKTDVYAEVYIGGRLCEFDKQEFIENIEDIADCLISEFGDLSIHHWFDEEGFDSNGMNQEGKTREDIENMEDWYETERSLMYDLN